MRDYDSDFYYWSGKTVGIMDSLNINLKYNVMMPYKERFSARRGKKVLVVPYGIDNEAFCVWLMENFK